MPSLPEAPAGALSSSGISAMRTSDEQEACDAAGVLEGVAGELGRIDDAGLHEVFLLLPLPAGEGWGEGGKFRVVADAPLLVAHVLQRYPRLPSQCNILPFQNWEIISNHLRTNSKATSTSKQLSTKKGDFTIPRLSWGARRSILSRLIPAF